MGRCEKLYRRFLLSVSVLTQQELCCSLVAVSSVALGQHIHGDEQCLPVDELQKVHRGVLGTECVEQFGVPHALEGVRAGVASPTALVGTLPSLSHQTLAHSSCHRPR